MWNLGTLRAGCASLFIQDSWASMDFGTRGGFWNQSPRDTEGQLYFPCLSERRSEAETPLIRKTKKMLGFGVGLCGLRTCILCTVIGRIVQGFVPRRHSSAGATFSRISSLCIVHIRLGHERKTARDLESRGKRWPRCSGGQSGARALLGSTPHRRPPWLTALSRGRSWAHASSGACCSFPGCFLSKGFALKSSSQGWLLRKTNLKQPSLDETMY